MPIINNSLDKVMNLVVDAVTESGKKFSQIDKASILAFLQNQGVPNNKLDTMYEKLTKFYKGDKPEMVQGSVSMNTKPAVVDYADTSHNDVKVRQPRKSVFSDIKKIAG